MSETLKPGAQQEELNTVSTPEEAVSAATSESLAENNTQEQPVEVKEEENAAPTVSDECDNNSARPATRQEVIDRLGEIAGCGDVLNCKGEADALKALYYKLRTAEIDEERKGFVENGGEEEVFIPTADALEEIFKNALNVVKEKRAAQIKANEEEQKANLAQKEAILEQLKALVEKAEQETPEVNEFRNLCNSWKEIKNIPQESVTPLWKQYQILVEQFYDVLKLNHEFREYDFKKNLEIKTRICTTAEALAEDEDIVNAFRQLQQLHNEFRETGPVAPEQREEVWARFKAASTTINRRHQEHFEGKKERERENLEKKTALCEAIEAIDLSALGSYQAWNAATEKILELQAQWKEIGFAPQKMNTKIFERFRSACDNFFSKKSEFFKEVKSTLSENLEKKRALCKRAEELQESEDWKATADELTKLQKEWKAIGAVPQKHSEALWKRFVGACDTFFERRNKATSSQRSVEQENLKQKREIIAKVAAISGDLAPDEQVAAVNELNKEWNAVGHVPFKEKDKIYKEFRAAVNAIYERLHISANERRLADFRNNIAKGGNSLQRERERLIRQYEAMKAEIKTYENNLGFLSTSNKKGEGLVEMMRQKMETLKKDAEVLLKKIHLVEDELDKNAE